MNAQMAYLNIPVAITANIVCYMPTLCGHSSNGGTNTACTLSHNHSNTPPPLPPCRTAAVGLPTYHKPKLPANLNEGFTTNYTAKEEGIASPVDTIIQAASAANTDWSSIGICTYRNNLNKILQTPQVRCVCACVRCECEVCRLATIFQVCQGGVHVLDTAPLLPPRRTPYPNRCTQGTHKPPHTTCLSHFNTHVWLASACRAWTLGSCSAATGQPQARSSWTSSPVPRPVTPTQTSLPTTATTLRHCAQVSTLDNQACCVVPGGFPAGYACVNAKGHPARDAPW